MKNKTMENKTGNDECKGNVARNTFYAKGGMTRTGGNAGNPGSGDATQQKKRISARTFALSGIFYPAKA
ncbi:MAG: hypothetical protein U5N26_06175 [Candidatus Marinimicrobia bacterium]|nr:hypothetical protein [Candidatus Neomarinimicrobiota bacterium]